jgi:hypothetical protein
VLPEGPRGGEDLVQVAVLQSADGRPAVETATRAGQEAELGALVDAPCGEDLEDGREVLHDASARELAG